MYQEEINIDRPKDLPEQSYKQMLEAMAEQKKQEIAAAQAYQDGLKRLKADYSAAVRALISQGTRSDQTDQRGRGRGAPRRDSASDDPTRPVGRAGPSR